MLLCQTCPGLLPQSFVCVHSAVVHWALCTPHMLWFSSLCPNYSFPSFCQYGLLQDFAQILSSGGLWLDYLKLTIPLTPSSPCTPALFHFSPSLLLLGDLRVVCILLTMCIPQRQRLLSVLCCFPVLRTVWPSK